MSQLPGNYDARGVPLPPGVKLVRTEYGLELVKTAGAVSAVPAPAAPVPVSANGSSGAGKWLLLGASFMLLLALGKSGRR